MYFILLSVGFLLHSNTEISNVNILGSDLIRPRESAVLCGGGAIETPGCISYFGPSSYQIELACYDQISDDFYEGIPATNDTNYNDLDSGGARGNWITGGLLEWAYEQRAFGGIRGITVRNVRINDPEARGHKFQGDPRLWPASQVAFLLAGTPDGSYVRDITLDKLNSITTVADGMNIGGNVGNLRISNCYIANTGDDAFGFWQGPSDQSLALVDSIAVNPGIRQGTQHGSGDALDGRPYR